MIKTRVRMFCLFQSAAMLLCFAGIMSFSGCNSALVASPSGRSFLKGTLIRTTTGTMPIEEITKGTIVRSYDLESDEPVDAKVIAVSAESYTGTIVTIRTEESRIRTTASHVFLVKNLDNEQGGTFPVPNGYNLVQAAYLLPDDELLLPDGRSTKVKDISLKTVEEQTVYDIVTEATHLLLAGNEGVVAGDRSIVITTRRRLYSGTGACFTAGTMVTVPDGYKPIDTFTKGDRVNSYDPDTGLWVEKRVISTFASPYSGPVVTLNPGPGQIEVSGNHPVFVLSGDALAERPEVREVPTSDLVRYKSGSIVSEEFPGSRWIEALHLKPGDFVASVNGPKLIDEISLKHRDTTIYNIEIDGTHTYAVGLSGLLVHNKGSAEMSAAKAPMSSESMVAAERAPAPNTSRSPAPAAVFNTESYSRIYEQRFLKAADNPLSTLSIDVDTASYSNVRRFIQGGTSTVQDSVRIEEMINYFEYDYPLPENGHPFGFYTELSDCPWNDEHELLHVGIKGKEVPMENLPPNNIVFLLDVSGSMEAPNKLPLLKSSLALLIGQMRENDTISIVVYAGAAGLVLPPTSCTEKDTILNAMDRLQAGGSTAGGAGIKLAYATALEHFNPEGNNRVILGTDGDFNVGQSSEGELVRLIEEKRNDGIYLTILGFGMGNYKDDKMESLSNAGNGNYAYIDTIKEAKKVLVQELTGTLFTIANDVKIQIEFNPNIVDSYRLVGYENRILDAEDFADDTRDAGDMGAGHSVTVLYEIVPADGASGASRLRYQTSQVTDDPSLSSELMYLKFRYKNPGETSSIMVDEPVLYDPLAPESVSNTFAFSAAVASFGMLLRDSEFKGNSSYESVLSMAEQSLGDDPEGYRTEFLGLIKMKSWKDSTDAMK